MPKLSDFIKAIAVKSKVDLTKPELISALEAAKDINLPDEVATQIETALMTEDAARSNSKVRGAIQAELLNGEDAFLKQEMADVLDDTNKGEFEAAPNTPGKIRASISILKKAIKTAKASGDKGTESALKQQVIDLNGQLQTIKTGHDNSIKELNGKLDQKDIDVELIYQLGAEKFSLPETMPIKRKVQTAMLLIKDELAQKGFKMVKTESGVVKLSKVDGTDPFDEKNNPITLTSFTKGVLAENGLLQNSAPPGQTNPITPILPAPGGQQSGFDHSSAMSEIDQQLKAAGVI